MSRLERAFCLGGPWRVFARRLVLPWALQGIPLRGQVLEVGSGSGAMAAELLRRFPEIHLTATDLDPVMVEALERRLAPFGVRAIVRRADATELPFPSDSFDTALSFLMLHHVGRWEQALLELVRVLRPGGTLLGCDLLAYPASDLVQRAVGRGDERLIPWRELASSLSALSLEGVWLRRGLGGLVARFRGVKTSAAEASARAA